MKKQVIFLSTTPWHAHPTRKQEVSKRLDDCEILYFDPPITYIAPIKDKSQKPRLKAYKEAGEKVAGHITRYSLPPVMPFYNKYRVFNRISSGKIARFVNKIAKQHGFEDPVLWVYHPSNVDAAKKINHSKLVYDCVDRHSGYPGLIDPTLVDGMEAELARECDAVFATAQGLYDTLSKHSDHAFFVPNGANFEMFHEASKPQERPEELRDITTPIIGFVGAIQQCIDRDLAAEVARRHPEWTFVFVGAPLAGVDVSMLEALPNVRLLGRKPHADVPKFIANFDICLNIFAEGDLSRDVSPLKFYEYLATGKPVVSTPQPLQVQQFSDSVYIADGADEFEKACIQALNEQGEEKRALRIEQGSKCSWESRVAEMRERLAELDILK